MNYFKEFDAKKIIVNALKEDMGSRDITTEAFIPANKKARAVILAKEGSVICGLGVAAVTFRLQDKRIRFKQLVKEGEFVKKGKIIAELYGNARSILTAERPALNFLSRLCGIATKTREFVEKVKPYRARIMDTRKTTPGLRILEKYAVRIGGGYNHRLSLDEMVLIKDNHLKVLGDRFWVMGSRIIKKKLSRFKTEIEVKTLKEFDKALRFNPDIIMLDNMSLKNMRKAVKIRNNLSPNTYYLTPKLEASGGVSLKNVKKIASTGVEMISVGELTHSAPAVDISLEII